MSRHVDPERDLTALRALAVDRIVSTKQAGRAGLSSFDLLELARETHLHHLMRGMWATERPADDKDEHLLRTLAVLRRHVKRSAATAHSALVLHGLPTLECDLARVHVQRESSTTTRRGKDYTAHLREGEITTMTRPPLIVAEAPVVDIETAIVLTGLLSGPRSAAVAADAAARAGLTTPDRLQTVAGQRYRGSKGIGAVRRALADVDGRRESPGETLTAQVCHGLGYDLEPQVWIGPYRVDFLIKGSRVVLEFDGAMKYRTPEDVVAEKRREDELRARGYIVVRLMWSDVYNPKKVKAKLERAMAASVA